tara:strand:- start:1208 stop:1840 length:633 start_codon:yes stop_codon:yes gene_type:complete
MKEKIIVFGAGEFGSLILNIVSFLKKYEIIAFGDDNNKNIKTLKNNIPILNQNELVKFAKENNVKSAICSIGDNILRSKKYKFFRDNGFKMVSLVHPNALIDSNVTFGKNVIIEMGTAIHTCSTIGNNVFLGGDALIGHHNKIGNHVLIGGNVSFGGSVNVNDYATFGVGSSIKPGVTIGEGAIIGVGAAVIKDVEPYTTVVGVPAKAIQ